MLVSLQAVAWPGLSAISSLDAAHALNHRNSLRASRAHHSTRFVTLTAAMADADDHEKDVETSVDIPVTAFLCAFLPGAAKTRSDIFRLAQATSPG